MIDKQYVESARSIRTEFLSLSKKLDSYKNDLENLSNFLQNTVKELQNITEKKATTKEDLTDMANKLVKKLQDVELEEIKITNLVKPINDRIEKSINENNSEEFEYIYKYKMVVIGLLVQQQKLKNLKKIQKMKMIIKVIICIVNHIFN